MCVCVCVCLCVCVFVCVFEVTSVTLCLLVLVCGFAVVQSHVHIKALHPPPLSHHGQPMSSGCDPGCPLPSPPIAWAASIMLMATGSSKKTTRQSLFERPSHSLYPLSLSLFLSLSLCLSLAHFLTPTHSFSLSASHFYSLSFSLCASLFLYTLVLSLLFLIQVLIAYFTSSSFSVTLP